MKYKSLKGRFFLSPVVRWMLLFSVPAAPLISEAAHQVVAHITMWWCSSCGLAYPVSQKCCLNNKCPAFKKRR